MSSCWMITITAREHHLSGARVQENPIDIYDIAWSLSQINRFTGHAKRPYSVAEHSLLVADLARHDGKSALVQLACLVHDAHEAYAGDISTPAKNAIGLSWAAFEHLQADRVRRALGVHEAFLTHARLVRHFDLVALATERQQLTAYNDGHHAPWPALDTPGEEIRASKWVNLNNFLAVRRRWADWRDEFLLRYFDLCRAVQADMNPLEGGTA